MFFSSFFLFLVRVFFTGNSSRNSKRKPDVRIFPFAPDSLPSCAFTGPTTLKWQCLLPTALAPRDNDPRKYISPSSSSDAAPYVVSYLAAGGRKKKKRIHLQSTPYPPPPASSSHFNFKQRISCIFIKQWRALNSIEISINLTIWSEKYGNMMRAIFIILLETA